MSMQKEGYLRLILTIVLAIGALSSAIFLFAEWNQLSLSEAIHNGQVEADIRGMAQDGRFMEPMLALTLKKEGILPLTVVIAPETTLSASSDSNAADLVILQTEKMMLLASNQSTMLVTYSLDYSKSFPNSSSTYKVTNTINTNLVPILNNIAALGAEKEIASQLAVWRSHNEVGLEKIETALGQDFSQYTSRVDEILQANKPPQLSTASSDLWLWGGAFVLFVVLTFILGFQSLNNRSRRVIDQLTDWTLLAEGGMAKVWRAYHQQFERVIVKFPQTHENKLYHEIVKYRFETEIEQHQKLHHPNIVPLIEYGDAIDPSSKRMTCYLIQEFVDGCTLDELIAQQENKRLPDTIILEITDQILSALGYIHSKKVIHRDLTLKNIMVEKTGQVHIIDFGNSTSIRSQNTEVRGLLNVGTPPFYAPPSIGNVPERDFYSLAMLILAMYGGTLIKEQDANEAKKAIEEELAHLTSIPGWLHVVLKQCWNGEYKDSATLRKALRLSQLDQMVTAIKGEKS